MAQGIGNFIDRIQIGTDEANQIAIGSSAYGVCTTDASVVTKTANIPGFALNTGTTIHIKFINNNSASAPTLNISNTGAKAIVQYGNSPVGIIDSADGWKAGAILTLTYDGTNWVRDQGYNSYHKSGSWQGLTYTAIALDDTEALTFTIPTEEITSVGTITSGIWQGTEIAVDKGGTGKTSWTPYGILYASNSSTLSQITAGASGNQYKPLISMGAAAPDWYNGILFKGTEAANYKAEFQGTTDSESTTTGAVKLSGGLGVAKQVTALRLAANGNNPNYELYINGSSYLNGTTYTKSIIHYNNAGVQDGSWITNVTGTAPTATTTNGTTTYSNAGIGSCTLTIGNNKIGENSANGVADNAKGILRLYSEGSTCATTSAYVTFADTHFYTETGLALPTNKIGIMFRPTSSSYYTHFTYQTAGEEALVMATQDVGTSFIFINGESYTNATTNNRWQSLTPALQIKRNCVSIGELIGEDVVPTYKLKVAGTTYINGDTSINGDIIFPTANKFDWNGGTYRQRLVITDDSTTNTAVFTFQQSTNTGTNYTNLLVIKDNGDLDVTGDITVNNIFTHTNNTYDIGTTGTRWQTAYLATSICLGAINETYNSNSLGNFMGPGLFTSNIVSTGNYGYYLFGNGVEYAYWKITTLGTNSANGVQGALGEVYLTLGNATAQGAADASTGENNARGIVKLYHTDATYSEYYADGWISDGNIQEYRMIGQTSTTANTERWTIVSLGNDGNVSTTNSHSQGKLRIYSSGTTYTDIVSQSGYSKPFYLPAYNDDMYAVHAGSNAQVGSEIIPVYVAANGRITPSSTSVGDEYNPTYLDEGTISITYPVQYSTFVFTSGSNTAEIVSEAFNQLNGINTYVLQIVVTSGEEYLNAPIDWSSSQVNNSDTYGVITLTTMNVSGRVSGYIITARGKNAPIYDPHPTPPTPPPAGP